MGKLIPYILKRKDRKEMYMKLRIYNTLTREKEEIKLDKDNEYIVSFIAKNRYGNSNVQLVYERDMSFNTYKAIGFTEIEYDGFNTNK